MTKWTARIGSEIEDNYYEWKNCTIEFDDELPIITINRSDDTFIVPLSNVLWLKKEVE